MKICLISTQLLIKIQTKYFIEITQKNNLFYKEYTLQKRKM